MKLWVIRHAKSSWADPGQTDFQRPLNRRGKHDGERIAQWMRVQTERPDWIVSSDARRARDTAEFVRSGYSVTADHLIFDHRLYEASAATIRDVVTELPESCPSAALVGHNPGSTEFVNAMVGTQVIDQLPTFGIALLEVPSRWPDVGFGSARLIALYTPKSLPG
jgi:phosphohistidine phosphatase